MDSVLAIILVAGVLMVISGAYSMLVTITNLQRDVLFKDREIVQLKDVVLSQRVQIKTLQEEVLTQIRS